MALRAYRLGRVREQLRKHDYAGILLYDPINIRYATDTANMQVWTMHNKVRYLFLPTEGPITLFDFHNCEHLADGHESVDEVRPAISYYYFNDAQRCDERAGRWADEVADLLRQHGGGNKRLAVDKLDPLGDAGAGARRRSTIADGEELMEWARAIKNADEIVAMNEAIAACEAGMRRDAERAQARHDRERALGASAPGQHRQAAANGSRCGCSPPASAPIRGSRNAPTG